MVKVDYYTPEMNKHVSMEERDLYWLYKNELWEISGEHGCSREAVYSWYDDIIKTSEINLIRLLDGSRHIGFMFIGVGGSCHADADYYLWDAYILPEYRRQSYMTSAFQTFVRAYGHEGKYCLFLIDNNLPAVNFWNKQFGLLGYKECGIDDYADLETPWCHIHAFSGQPLWD